MRLKVMITGRSRRIAEDLCERLETDRRYKTIECPVSRNKLFDMVQSKKPDVIIICAGDETKETVKVFDILKESKYVNDLAVIVVASDEDRRTFMGISRLERVTFLERPVPLGALFEKLDEVEKQLQDKLAEAENEEDVENPGETESTWETEILFGDDISPEKEDAGLAKELSNLPEFPGRKHILVVDDDPIQLLMIKEQLKDLYDVTVVKNGRNALKALKKQRTDLILLDYLMPEMNGPEVLMQIRENPDCRDIPVIFLTGMSERDIVIKTLVELKPQGYVLKPSKRADIIAKIQGVIG